MCGFAGTRVGRATGLGVRRCVTDVLLAMDDLATVAGSSPWSDGYAPSTKSSTCARWPAITIRSSLLSTVSAVA